MGHSLFGTENGIGKPSLNSGFLYCIHFYTNIFGKNDDSISIPLQLRVKSQERLGFLTSV